MKGDKEILQEHLNDLYKTSKDGDEVVGALRRMIQLLDDSTWINANIDLMIAVNDGQLNVYNKGNRIERIQELKFSYNKEEVSSIEIKQII